MGKPQAERRQSWPAWGVANRSMGGSGEKADAPDLGSGGNSGKGFRAGANPVCRTKAILALLFRLWCSFHNAPIGETTYANRPPFVGRIFIGCRAHDLLGIGLAQSGGIFRIVNKNWFVSRVYVAFDFYPYWHDPNCLINRINASRPRNRAVFLGVDKIDASPRKLLTEANKIRYNPP